jgi:hypothetical protein
MRNGSVHWRRNTTTEKLCSHSIPRRGGVTRTKEVALPIIINERPGEPKKFLMSAGEVFLAVVRTRLHE